MKNYSVHIIALHRQFTDFSDIEHYEFDSEHFTGKDLKKIIGKMFKLGACGYPFSNLVCHVSTLGKDVCRVNCDTQVYGSDIVAEIRLNGQLIRNMMIDC